MSTRLGLTGVSGRLGQRVLRSLADHPQFDLCSATVSSNSRWLGEPLQALWADAPWALHIGDAHSLECQVIVDFSQPDGLAASLSHCQRHRTPLVSATTALNDDHHAALQALARHVPVLWDSNFSLQIQWIRKLLRDIAAQQTVRRGLITETHHRNKKDAPSGTAISLARCLEPEAPLQTIGENRFACGVLEIHSHRLGEEAAMHEVHLWLDDDELQLKHRAVSADIFAQGALKAAAWLLQQPPGLYAMADVLGVQA